MSFWRKIAHQLGMNMFFWANLGVGSNRTKHKQTVSRTNDIVFGCSMRDSHGWNTHGVGSKWYHRNPKPSNHCSMVCALSDLYSGPHPGISGTVTYCRSWYMSIMSLNQCTVAELSPRPGEYQEALEMDRCSAERTEQRSSLDPPSGF